MTSTDPFLPDTPAILSQTHQHVARARAVHRSFGTIELDVLDGSIVWDEMNAPRVTADLTVERIDDPTLLDPRTGVRIELDLGYRRAGGVEDVWTLANLGVRDMTEQQPDGSLTLGLGGDEFLMLDASAIAYSTLVTANTTLAMKALLGRCISPAPRVVTALTGAAVSMTPVTDQWATINDLADQNDWKVYDDGLRTWHIEASASGLAGTPDLELTVGEGGTVVGHNSQVSREGGWYNYVFLRYRWRDTGGVEQYVHATAYVSSGPFAVTGPAGKRVYMEDREVPVSQATANAAAAAMLRRTQTRARTMSVEAVSAYWLRPGMTVAVTPRYATSAQKWLVQRVQFGLTSRRMTVTTRTAGDAAPYTITTTTPVSLPKDPDPAPGTGTTYVSRWIASASRSYKGDGTENTFIPPECGQGYFDTTNGNQRSLFLFAGSNSTGDEVGVSVTTALTGAQVIAVRIRFKVTHTFSSSSALRIGRSAVASLPATLPSATPYKVQTVRENDQPWVNITTDAACSMLEGSGRGFTLGAGRGTNQLDYLKVNGASASTNKPELEITYKK